VPRFAVRRLDEIPTVPDADFAWHPLQHHFGLTAFGANVFVATAPGDVLVEEHDELGSGQEELYVVLRGRVMFRFDGEEHEAEALSVAAVPDASVRRRATALEAGTALLALGTAPSGFRSTWRSDWFSSVPQA
jgi:quercetin dioxygenase-like cupin family protein